MEQHKDIRYWKLILGPALFTLAVTLLRLAAELMNLPAWLASKGPGGPGALIGIAWLPPIFGAYFALKLANAPGRRWLKLLKALLLYGLATRVPVIIIMGLAIYGNWGTHYDAFAGSMADASAAVKFWQGGVLIQLIWWVLIWTVGTGMITGLITFLVRPAPKSTKSTKST